MTQIRQTDRQIDERHWRDQRDYRQGIDREIDRQTDMSERQIARWIDQRQIELDIDTGIGDTQIAGQTDRQTDRYGDTQIYD